MRSCHAGVGACVVVHACVPREQFIVFATQFSGELRCHLTDAGTIAMSFPALHTALAEMPDGLIKTLGLASGTAVIATHYGPYDWIIELASPEDVVNAKPDFGALAQFDCRGVALTALGPSRSPHADHAARHGPDVVSRFFAPRLRIAEDSVTGSLHCVLAPYYAPRRGLQLTCRQASARGGTIETSYDPATQRVELAGSAVTTVHGELLVTASP